MNSTRRKRMTGVPKNAEPRDGRHEEVRSWPVASLTSPSRKKGRVELPRTCTGSSWAPWSSPFGGAGVGGYLAARCSPGPWHASSSRGSEAGDGRVTWKLRSSLGAAPAGGAGGRPERGGPSPGDLPTQVSKVATGTCGRVRCGRPARGRVGAADAPRWTAADLSPRARAQAEGVYGPPTTTGSRSGATRRVGCVRRRMRPASTGVTHRSAVPRRTASPPAGLSRTWAPTSKCSGRHRSRLPRLDQYRSLTVLPSSCSWERSARTRAGGPGSSGPIGLCVRWCGVAVAAVQRCASASRYA